VEFPWAGEACPPRWWPDVNAEGGRARTARTASMPMARRNLSLSILTRATSPGPGSPFAWITRRRCRSQTASKLRGDASLPMTLRLSPKPSIDYQRYLWICESATHARWPDRNRTGWKTTASIALSASLVDMGSMDTIGPARSRLERLDHTRSELSRSTAYVHETGKGPIDAVAAEHGCQFLCPTFRGDHPNAD